MGQLVLLTFITALTMMFTSHVAVADFRQPRQLKTNELKYLNELERVTLEKLFSNSLEPMRFKRPDSDCTSTTEIPPADTIPVDRKPFGSAQDVGLDRLKKKQEVYNTERKYPQSIHIGIPKMIPELNAEVLAVCRNIITRASQNYDYY